MLFEHGFKDTLRNAGITKAELARRFDINPRTVSAWGSRPPKYVMVYLELLVEYNRVRPL